MQNISHLILQIDKHPNARKLKSQLLKSDNILEFLKESKFLAAKWICELLDDYNDSKLDYSQRLDAIKDLNVLLRKLENSEFLTDILPGIISSLIKIVASNGKVVLRKHGLDALGLIFLNSMSKQYKSKILEIFKVFLSKITIDYSHEMRKSYGQLLISLLENSIEYLKEFVLNGLLELSLDEYENIAENAKVGLLNYKIELIEKFDHEIQNLNLKTSDSKGNLKVLNGILMVLRDCKVQYKEFMFSHEYLGNILQSLEIKTTRKIEIQQGDVKEYKMPADSEEILKILKFRDLETMELSNFFQLWGQSMTFGQVQSFIVNLIPFINPNSSQSYQPQAIFILGSLIKGLKKEGGLDNEEIRFLRKMYKDITSFQIGNLPLNKNQQALQMALAKTSPWNHLADFCTLDVSKVDRKFTALFSDEDYQRNALISSLFLSFLSDLSFVLRLQFEPFLIDGLYPILEKLGNSNGAVSLAAWKALSDIAFNMGAFGVSNEDKVKTLLIENVDYIINHVSRNLREFESHPYAPNVLSASIRIVGLKILDFLDDSILELLDLLGEYHNVNEHVIQVILNVFHALADIMTESATNINMLPDIANPVKMDLSSEFGNASAEMVAFFLRNGRSEQKNESVNDESIESAKEFFRASNKKEEECVDEDNDPKEDQIVPESKSVAISKECKFSGQILPKLVHFLTVDSPQLRKYVIELLGKLVPFLMERESFIHTVWSNLVNRLNDPQYYIVEEALSVISKISNLVPEFVSKRIGDDIIPKVLVIFANLNKDLEERTVSDSDGMIVSNLSFGKQTYSKRFKIILRVMDHIQDLLRSIIVNYQDTKNLTESLIPLLHQDYPGEITSCAILMLRHLLSKNHGDLVYLRLWIACSATQLIPFSPNLRKLYISALICQKSDKYVLNASAVLDHPLSAGWEEAVICNGKWMKSV